jgi:predicted dehydrogenase
MTKTYKLGVIGADRRGRIAFNAHRPEQGFELIAACGLKPEALGEYRERCGEHVLLSADYRDLVNHPEIDAIFICSPDDLHEEHAIAALKAGKSIYLEKPMAITTEGCDNILRAAEESGAGLYLGHNLRFAPVFKKMKELIVSGVIGEVQAIWCRHFISYGGDAYFRDWHSERSRANSLLLQKGAHDIDIIHWLAGSHSTRVVGMGKLSVYDKLPRRKEGDPQPSVEFNRANWPPKSTGQYSPVIDVEDHSMVLMNLENGVQASYMQCHYTPDDCRNYTVIGTEGRIENYGDRSTPDKWATVHLWNRRTGFDEQGHEVFRIPHVDGSHSGADPAIIEDFLGMLKGTPPAGATPWDARSAVAVGDAAARSLRKGNIPVAIPCRAK